MYLVKESENVIKNKPLGERKLLGQYFTNNFLKDKLLECLPLKEKANILEPSYGTGEFIVSIQNYFGNPIITGIELDEKLFKNSKKYLKDCKLLNENFLNFETENKFDYIIGNPPYFQLPLSKEEKKKYSDIITGRMNIYSLFIYKSIQLLKDDGYLAFVIPKTLNTGSYFKGIRDYIVKNTNIKKIIYFDENEFEGALQEVQILILKKEDNDGSHIIKLNNENIFVDNKKEAEKLFKKYETVESLGYEVKTGSVVWNQNKEDLSNNEDDGDLLIWANNISDGKIIKIEQAGDKGQYIKGKEPIKEKAIVVNRIIGKPDSPSLKIAIIKEPFLGENHINIILPKNPKIKIEEMFKLLNDEKTLSSIRYITANTQLSKTELQNKLPLYFKETTK